MRCSTSASDGRINAGRYIEPPLRRTDRNTSRFRRPGSKAVAGEGGSPYDPRAMNRLDRYIFWQCLTMMVFVTAALTAAIWLAQSLRLIDLIVNRGLSIELFLYLALLILPRFLDIVLPIAVFIAILFTYNKLIGESEIIVMRAAGMSQLQLAKPAMILALLATALGFALSTYLLPMANRAFKDLQFEIRNQFASAVLQEGAFTA